ncbi:adenosine deaminase-like protein-like protein [Piromyces finnis]|uniref:Adenosine deaminase-like protein-like protein n=1 Tax=Piromyces finnis TaxID=1754191 RepID=A0A1Y1VH17_9FUNG|nr:adenosine deaminase-like protein-like protein [Piromyces finnis]|eukprot:ORX55373.1 adenosine deaminase-like protein-like protein [Piromyces finnis]
MDKFDKSIYEDFVKENYGSWEEFKQYCVELPKIEFHAHLNGSITPKTMNELIEQRKGKEPDLAGFAVKKLIQPNFQLEDFFPLFNTVYRLTDNTESIEYITRNVLKEFAADGVCYIELRSTPRQNLEKGMKKKNYAETLISVINEINKKNDIIVRLILSIDRKASLEEAMETVNLAIELKSTGIVVGVDMCGNTNGGEFLRIKPAFHYAKKNNLSVTLHVAEIPNCREDNLNMIEVSPNRMGHCTFLEDDLLKWAKDNNVAIETCITSNIICRTVKSYDVHPCIEYMKNDQPFTICTDDKGIFNCDLSDEYLIFGLINKLNKKQLFEVSKRAISYVMDNDIKLKKQLETIYNNFSKKNGFLIEK